MCVCARVYEASILSSPLDFCNLDGRDSVSRDRKRRRREGEAVGVAWHSATWVFFLVECLSNVYVGGVLRSDFIERKSNFFLRSKLDLPSRKEDHRNPCTGTGKSRHLGSSVDPWTRMFVEISLERREKGKCHNIRYIVIGKKRG